MIIYWSIQAHSSYILRPNHSCDVCFWCLLFRMYPVSGDWELSVVQPQDSLLRSLPVICNDLHQKQRREPNAVRFQSTSVSLSPQAPPQRTAYGLIWSGGLMYYLCLFSDCLTGQLLSFLPASQMRWNLQKYRWLPSIYDVHGDHGICLHAQQTQGMEHLPDYLATAVRISSP